MCKHIKKPLSLARKRQKNLFCTFLGRRECSLYAVAPAVFKTALLVSSLVDSSYDLYEHILNVMDKKKTNFSSLRIEKENQLIERALEFIKLKKEDWFKEDDSAE